MYLTSLFKLKNTLSSLLCCTLLLSGIFVSVTANAQTNVALSATASQSGGGVTVYGPANYNDNVITSWTSCSTACPTPWGWVAESGSILYTWTTAATFNKIVFLKADRPMSTCTVQYWNGSAFVTFATYTTAGCIADSITFPPITTTKLQFLNCVAPAINPNFREIQVWESGPTVRGDSLLCVGGTITLTASSTEPSPTYSWSGPAGYSATGATISLPATLASAGVYSCTVTSGGITSPPTTDTIRVQPQPSITLGTNPSVCYGSSFGSLAYTATVSSPTTYSITYSSAALGAGFVNVTSAALPSSPITVVVPSSAPVGTYNATITVSNALCSGPSTPFTVSVNPVPDSITGVTNICTGSIVTLHDVSAGYNWTSTNPAVATIDGTYGVVTAHTVGATIISYTDPSSGCAATTIVNVVGITGATSVCATDSVMLTATGPGTWSSGTPALATVGSTGFVTGRSTGVATISYTLGSGCIATWVMTVNPLALIVGRDSVCIGSTRNLTDIVGGGTWTTTFPLIASVVADSGKVTGLSVGLTTISYTLPVTGCMTTVDFNVVGYPVATTGSTRACPGTSTTLHDASTGGVWTSYDPSIATVIPGTGVVTGVRADTVDIFYTLNPGCSISTRVTINPLPEPITGNSVMCPYTTDTLHDATRGGRWTTTTPAVAALDTGILTGITGGLAVVSYTLPTSCAVVKIVTVGVAPAPIITYYNGTLYVSGTYATYQWYDSLAGEIHGATSPSIAAANEEYYYVVVTDSAGCVGTSSLFHFNFAMEGVANVSNNTAVNIYPNPTNGMLYIDAPVKVRAVISSIEGKKEIDVTDAKQVNIATLANGMYFVTLYDDNDNVIAVRKVVKQ